MGKIIGIDLGTTNSCVLRTHNLLARILEQVIDNVLKLSLGSRKLLCCLQVAFLQLLDDQIADINLVIQIFTLQYW